MVREKRQSWSGRPPTTDAEARERLIGAALACAAQKGLRRSTVADIARHAGVTRPTVYAHFDDRHAIFHAAFVEAIGRLSVGARASMATHATAAERAVEAVAYFVRMFPSDPCLRLTLTDEGLGEFTSQALLDEANGLQHARAILAPMFELAPQLLPHADEVVEVIVRFALSLLVIPGPPARTETELRAFLHRRMVPAIGLRDAPVTSAVR